MSSIVSESDLYSHVSDHTTSSIVYNVGPFGAWSWWHYQMETFSTLLAICAGNSPITGEFPAQRSVMPSFDVLFDLHRMNGWVNNCEAGDLRRHHLHYDVIVMWVELMICAMHFLYQQSIHRQVTVTIKRSYDQSKWRTPNTVSTDFRELCQQGTSFAVHIAHAESHGTDWFFGCEKLQRQGRILQISGWENFGKLIVTVTPGNRSLIVTAGYAWS